MLTGIGTLNLFQSALRFAVVADRFDSADLYGRISFNPL